MIVIKTKDKLCRHEQIVLANDVAELLMQNGYTGISVGILTRRKNK